MELSQLRVALTSGNYNYTRDGANQSLNRLVGHLLSKGAAVRVYSPVVDEPAFAPTGDLVGTPAVPIPGRTEYRVPLGLGDAARADLDRFAPNMIHVSAPEFLGHSAVRYARAHGLPVVASVHTRFDTYFRYYRMAFMEPVITAMLRRFYRRCDAIVAPSESMADHLRAQRMNHDVGIWSRGVDRTIFSPERRDMQWRRAAGIDDAEMVIGFVGRLVLEKGLNVFGDVIAELERRGVAHRVMVIGEGPARAEFESRLPKAVFTGFLRDAELGRAIASLDVLLNPSVTETFGNVTLEAAACGVAVVGARAIGTSSLVEDGRTGRLVEPLDIAGYADALAAYSRKPELRRVDGAAGAQFADRFSWDAINGTLAQTYLRVIAARNGPSMADDRR